MNQTTHAAMLTAEQAWQLAGGEKIISRASWYAALRRNEIPNKRLGKRFLVPRFAFENWLTGQTAEAAGQ